MRRGAPRNADVRRRPSQVLVLQCLPGPGCTVISGLSEKKEKDPTNGANVAVFFKNPPPPKSCYIPFAEPRVLKTKRKGGGEGGDAVGPVAKVPSK